jgi:hypothetical protein
MPGFKHRKAFGGKGGKRSEAATKSRDEQKPVVYIQYLLMFNKSDEQADQETPGHIYKKSPDRENRMEQLIRINRTEVPQNTPYSASQSCQKYFFHHNNVMDNERQTYMKFPDFQAFETKKGNLHPRMYSLLENFLMPAIF